MSTQTITLRKVDVLSDDDINSRKDWLSARQRLLNRAQELRRVRDQLIVEGCALNCAKADEELVFDAPAGTVMQAELLNRREPIVSQMLRVSSAGSCWYSPDRGGVFASPTPQTAELVAELFATERDCFHPL